MQTFTLPVKYEAIIIPTGSFLLLKDLQASIEALNNFYEHLLPGGRLIIDIFLQPDLKKGLVSTRSWTTNKGELITLEEKLIEVNYINQYTVSHFRYEKWKDQQLIQTELEYFPLRWYGVEEFKMILENIGFADITISADYKFDEFPTDPEQTITFEAFRL